MISINEVKPGMVLAAELRSPQGRLLLPKGTTIAPQHMRIFKIWGICEADIVGAADHDTEGSRLVQLAPPQALALAKKLAAVFFAHANHDHEVIAELIKLFVFRTATRVPLSELEKMLNNRALAEGREQRQAAVREQSQPIDLDELVQSNVQLASLPDIFVQITDAINNPRSSAAYVADIISKDISLAAKLLKMVNSAFYGFPSEIETLSRAVTVIGTSQLTTLALGVSVTTMFQGIPPELINLKQFWKHSLACGLTARHIAARLAGFNEERFFVAGLLHDIGRLIICKNYPVQATEALLASAEKNILLHHAERELWGFDHACIASTLLQQWNFPASLEAAVRFHHTPGEARSSLEPGIVHLADIIAHSITTAASGNRFIPPLEPQVWDMLGFSKSLLSQIIDQVEYQMDELIKIFFADDE